MTAVELTKLKPGMVLEKDIRNFSGNILFRKGTRLTEKHIKTLKSWGQLGICNAKHSPVSKDDSKEAREVRRQTAALFRYTNRDHEVVKLLMRLAFSKKIKHLSEKKEAHDLNSV